MLMDILPKKSIWYIIHKFLRHERSVSSETILISNPCFKYFLSFSIRIFFFNRWQMYVHNLLKPVGWLHPQQRWSKRAPDLAWFSRYSLFGPLHFSSSVYILACLYLSNFSTAEVSLQSKCWAVFDCTAEYLKKVKDYVTKGSKQYKFYLGTKRRQKNDAFGVFLIETSRQKMGFQVNSLKFRMPRIHDFQVTCTLKVKCRTMQRVYDLLKNPEVLNSQSRQNWRYRSLKRPWYLKNSWTK